MLTTIRRALISVADKTGVIEFAKQLCEFNIEIISSGGTAKALQAENIPVTEISDYTGFPEMMNGRVKTLHPKIHAGILARRGIDDATLAQHNIAAIDLVVVNLYPFQQVIADPQCQLSDAIENIDIGGPTLIRAAAKNHLDVTVVTNPQHYLQIIEELQQHAGKISANTRQQSAQQAFAHTAQYDAAIANFFGRHSNENSFEYPETYTQQWIKQQDLRYGENAHQTAALYRDRDAEIGSIATAQQIQGKALSYNNLADADAALNCVKRFAADQATCVIVKHANPCGIACADNQVQAYQRAFATDSTSSFGGIIAFNQKLSAEVAETIIDNQFVEVIIAPEVSSEAQQILKNKPNVRVLACGQWSANAKPRYDFKKLTGALLIQQADQQLLNETELKVVTTTQPTPTQMQDCLFAWRVASQVKSNAIVFAKDNATIGIGAGQMSRIDSVKIAARKANEANLTVKNSVLASDAFFPFADSIETAANLGITAIIQPGGSIRDAEIIDAANKAGIVMLFTGLRHFRH